MFTLFVSSIFFYFDIQIFFIVLDLLGDEESNFKGNKRFLAYNELKVSKLCTALLCFQVYHF